MSKSTTTENATASTSENTATASAQVKVQFSLASNPAGNKPNFTTKLENIVSIEDCPVKALKETMRKIDTANYQNCLLGYIAMHVAKLNNEPAAKPMPPIDVQNTSVGLLLANGYHRFEAMIAFARLLHHDVDFNAEDFDAFAMLDSFGAISLEEQNFINNQTVACHHINAKSITHLIDFCYTANFSNGKAADKKTRVKYAAWLYNNKIYPTMRQAALKAGISHPTLVEHLNSKSVKQAEMTSEQKALDDQDRVLTLFASHIRKAFKALKDEENAAEVLANYVKFEDVSDFNAVFDVVIEACQIVATQKDVKVLEDSEDAENATAE